MNLEDVMKKPLFVSPRETLQNAAKLLTRTNSAGFIVGTETGVQGIVTKEDLVKHFGHKELVSEIMTKSVIVAQIDDPIKKVIQLLKKNRINFIPVVKKNKVVGIVSSKDILAEKEDEEEEFLFS